MKRDQKSDRPNGGTIGVNIASQIYLASLETNRARVTSAYHRVSVNPAGGARANSAVGIGRSRRSPPCHRVTVAGLISFTRRARLQLSDLPESIVSCNCVFPEPFVACVDLSQSQFSEVLRMHNWLNEQSGVETSFESSVRVRALFLGMRIPHV